MKRILSIMFVIAIITMIGTAMAQTANDGRFIVYKANETVLDTKTNLMWAAKDNGSDISWTNAKVYCESYNGGGYTDWRMPTKQELASLYDEKKTRQAPCIETFSIHVASEAIVSTCFATWTSETRGPDASQFNFAYGTQSWYLQSHTYGTRALPVRANK